VAFLGLGVMGYPMAGHLARAGHSVTVYNRTPAKAAAWAAEYGGATARHAPRGGRGRRIRLCLRGQRRRPARRHAGPDGAFAGMAAGRHLRGPHHRIGRSGARAVCQARAQGLHFIDAPVSGGQAGAVNGALTVMCGGDAAPFDAMKPVAMNFAQAP
jgi:3-hydroxyisobutyrate dehydrogenase